MKEKFPLVDGVIFVSKKILSDQHFIKSLPLCPGIHCIQPRIQNKNSRENNPKNVFPYSIMQKEQNITVNEREV